jgi:hypothetical protein
MIYYYTRKAREVEESGIKTPKIKSNQLKIGISSL